MCNGSSVTSHSLHRKRTAEDFKDSYISLSGQGGDYVKSAFSKHKGKGNTLN